MEKTSNANRIHSISESHRLLGLPKPLHPLISLLDASTIKIDVHLLPNPHVLNFYKISYRTKLTGKIKYGQSYYDFDEGSLLFAAPTRLLERIMIRKQKRNLCMATHCLFILISF